MNIITVKINGVEYNLKGEEQEDYLHKVARYVDKR
ncbi:cell division protein ZapA [Clostridium botulinum]|nr:cell division protein ZapA [Clostridium botulinum]